MKPSIMKKTIPACMSLFVLMNFANAQQSSFGFTAGAVFASYKVTISSVSVTSKTKAGFTLGLTSSFAMGKRFSFESALNFLQKGGVIKEEGTTDKLTTNYLELPLNFVYNIYSAKGIFFAGGGPSIGVGLFGKDRYSDYTHSETTNILFGESADIKPYEAGINLLAGYRFKRGFIVTLNYNAGLNNTATTIDDYSSKMHNRYFGLRIGYMIPGKRKK